VKDINLLPDDIRQPQEPIKTEKSGVSTVKVVTLVIAIIALVGVSLVLPKIYIVMQNTRLEMINNNIESDKFIEVKSVNADIANIKREVEKKNSIVIDIDSKSISVNQIVNYINNSVTKGCTIESVKMNENNIVIEGNAIDPLKATEFASYVSRIEYLQITESLVESKDDNYRFKYAFTITRKDGI